MKNKLSFIACLFIILVLVNERTKHSELRGKPEIKVTTWDALGYYMYLPAIFIYDDYKELKWFQAIDSTYSLSGGWFYQAGKTKNGNYVCKYLGGVAVMQAPFFLIAHWVAPRLGYKADGFSKPYQYAVVIGLLFYCLLAFLILRIVLLKFYSDLVTALTLVLIGLASNYVQYAAVDSGQSHAYIFLLYTLVIYTTIKWHEKPAFFWAGATGFIMGLAAISRPTEAIIFLIPALWNTHTKEFAKQKWAMVKARRSHVIIGIIFLIVGLLPQLLYWKSATGSFIYDVGSKWSFANPNFQVLFGFEKGWLIYTPVALLFVVGLFFVKPYPFRKSVLWFCILNIYIIISWHDWRYGGSYSTRALVQSYPVFALGLGALIARLITTKWKYVLSILSPYLIYVNLFQLNQYNDTILHYNDMNRQYYSRIYLNKNPTALDMSALDTNDIIRYERTYKRGLIKTLEKPLDLKFPADSFQSIYEFESAPPTNWIKIEANIRAETGFNKGYLCAEIVPLNPHRRDQDNIIQRKVRLFSPISSAGKSNPYAFYVKVPAIKNKVRVYVKSNSPFLGSLEILKVTELSE